MRIIRALLLSGAAVAAATGAAFADGAVDIDQLAAQAAPALPPGSQLLVISKTPMVEVPGLPRTTKEINREGDRATTIRILPATGEAAQGGVSWSGYTRAGAVYKGSN